MARAHWLVVALVTLMTACTTGPGPGEPAQRVSDDAIAKSPNDSRDYRAITLDNGLEVLLISDPQIEVAGASLSVGVGSYQNPPQIPGLAHYLEHMLFLGTEKYPEPNSFQTFVQQNAGFTNAYTATDHTNYFFQVNAGVFDQALDRYSDYFKAPTFDRQYSDKERRAVDSEWSTGRSQDSRILNRLRGLTANPAHPARRMSVGNLETLQDQPGQPLYESMREFFQRYYSADNMKLVLFSNQPLDSLSDLASEHFSAVEDKNVARPTVQTPGLTESEWGRHIHYQPQKPMRRLKLEFPIADNTDQWRLKPNRYLANLISSEEPDTAAQILREKGWVDDFTASARPAYYGRDGFFTINIGVTEQGMAHRDEIIATVFEYLDLIRERGVDDLYYREYKAMLEKQFADMQVPNPLNQAIYYSHALFDRPARHIIDANYTFERFDPGAIRAVLEQLQPQRARIWHIHPDAPVDTDIPYYLGRYGVEPVTEADRQRWERLGGQFELALPAENDLFSSDSAEVVQATIETPELVTEREGLEAWLAHSQHHQSELGYLQVMFNTDLPHRSVHNRVMSDLVNRLFAQQTTALRDKAGRAGIGMGIERPRDNHALTLSGYSAKHPVLYRRLLERWVNFEVTEQGFEIALKGFTDAIEGRSGEEPNRQLFRQLDRLLAQPSWTDRQLLQAARELDADQLQAYHRQLLEANRVRIFAFGNYDRDTVAGFAETTTEFLPDSWQALPRTFTDYRPLKAGNVITEREDIEQTDNALLRAFYAPEGDLDTGARLLLLNALFHQAFYTQLRTEEQIGYVVGSSVDRIGDQWGFLLYAQTTNTPLDELDRRFLQFARDYQSELEALEPTVLDGLRQSVIEQVNQPPGNFYDEYPRYLNDFYRGNDDFDTRQRLVDAIGAVEKVDLLALYEQLILEGESQQVRVQLRGSEFSDTPFAP